MDNFKASSLIALVTFIIAIIVTSISQSRVHGMTLIPATIVLLVIIFTGVFSDMIGVAATVAKEEPFNAKAAKKVFGSKEGLYIAKRGERVASVMCDIVGDICGTISGAIGAVIVIRIVNNFSFPQTPINLTLIGFISALTVGGKAYCKRFAMKKSEEIIFFVGKILAFFKLVKSTFMEKIRGV